MSKGRARSRAVRERMAETGENWTTAARAVDANHGVPADTAGDAGSASADLDIDQLPRRVVDRENQGWYLGATAAGGFEYRADYGFKRGLDGCSYDELLAELAPLREVLPITAEDSAQLRRLFDAAGRRTVTSLAAALDQVLHVLRSEYMTAAGDDPNDLLNAASKSTSWDFALRTIRAGREGSWESELLLQIGMFGNELNLLRPKRGEDLNIAERRTAGPTKRVDKAVRDELAEILTRWVSAPDRYTEVAETLASEVSSYADGVAGPDGWRAIADQWLQPGGLAVEDIHNCYQLFYSLSEHYDADVL